MTADSSSWRTGSRAAATLPLYEGESLRAYARRGGDASPNNSAKKCPVNAISGEKGKTHRIDPAICTKCGTCVENCKFQAIRGRIS